MISNRASIYLGNMPLGAVVFLQPECWLLLQPECWFFTAGVLCMVQPRVLGNYHRQYAGYCAAGVLW